MDKKLGRREFVKVAGGAALAAGVRWESPQTPAAPGPDAGERELALLALDSAKSEGAAYADVRVSRGYFESVSTRERQITNVSKSDSYGIGVRALAGGSWGFSATRDLSKDSVVRTAREASHLWLTIHESIAHPTELDRALGYEANYAGTTFLAPPEKVLGKFKLGREFMTFVGNRTEPGGCATTGWDDEGVPATSFPIIDKGIFVSYQSATREMINWVSSLSKLKEAPGHSYGQDWSAIPFPRMPNVSLVPAARDISEAEVVAATKRGIFIEGDGSYSIDQQRYNFQFGGQVFWEIRDGKKVRMLRDVAYFARTPEFWNSMAMIGGRQTYQLGGNGKISRPVTNFRFNQSLAELLQNVEMLGKPTRVCASENSSVGQPIVVPALKVKEFFLSSVSDAI